MRPKEVHNKMSKSSLLRTLISPHGRASTAKIRTSNNLRDGVSDVQQPESLFSQVAANHAVQAVVGRPDSQARNRAQGFRDDQAPAIEELRYARSIQHGRPHSAPPGQIKIPEKSHPAQRQEQAVLGLPQPQAKLPQASGPLFEGRPGSRRTLVWLQKLAS